MAFSQGGSGRFARKQTVFGPAPAGRVIVSDSTRPKVVVRFKRANNVVLTLGELSLGRSDQSQERRKGPQLEPRRPGRLSLQARSEILNTVWCGRLRDGRSSRD